MIELKRETVRDGDLSVTVQEANGLIGMRRQMMRVQAFNNPMDDNALMTLAAVTFPDYVSAMVTSSGLPEPLTFEAFIDLPEPFLNAWGAAVYRLNGHWLSMPQDEAEKKPSASGNGLDNSLPEAEATHRPHSRSKTKRSLGGAGR